MDIFIVLFFLFLSFFIHFFLGNLGWKLKNQYSQNHFRFMTTLRAYGTENKTTWTENLYYGSVKDTNQKSSKVIRSFQDVAIEYDEHSEYKLGFDCYFQFYCVVICFRPIMNNMYSKRAKNGVIITNYYCCWCVCGSLIELHSIEMAANFFSFRFCIYLFWIDVDNLVYAKSFNVVFLFFFFAADAPICCNRTQLRYLHFNLQLTNANPKKKEEKNWIVVQHFNFRSVRVYFLLFDLVRNYRILVREKTIKSYLCWNLYIQNWQWTSSAIHWLVVVFCQNEQIFT